MKDSLLQQQDSISLQTEKGLQDTILHIIDGYHDLLSQAQVNESFHYNASNSLDHYSLMVSVISVLVGILAIVAGVFFYLISYDFQKKREKLFSEIKGKNDQFKESYQKSFQDLLNNTTEQLTKADQEFQNLLKTIKSESDIIGEEAVAPEERKGHKIFTINKSAYKRRSIANTEHAAVDIEIDQDISDDLFIYSAITKTDIHNDFIWYLQLEAEDKTSYWMGFAFNKKTTILKYHENESLLDLASEGFAVQQKINILEEWRLRGFNTNSKPKRITKIRLRGPRETKGLVTLSFRFSNK